MNKKIIIISIIVLIIIGVSFYEFLICKTGVECYTSPGFSVTMICSDDSSSFPDTYEGMRKSGIPILKSEITDGSMKRYTETQEGEWCQEYHGSEPSSCFSKHPLCFFE